MAKKKEEPIVDNETGSLKVKEAVKTEPTGNETKGNVTKVKEKMKMKPQVIEETVTKVDLSTPPEAKQEDKYSKSRFPGLHQFQRSRWSDEFSNQWHQQDGLCAAASDRHR